MISLTQLASLVAFQHSMTAFLTVFVAAKFLFYFYFIIIFEEVTFQRHIYRMTMIFFLLGFCISISEILGFLYFLLFFSVRCE